MPDPAKLSKLLKSGDLEVTPFPVWTLLDETFRAVKVTAGDSISAAVSSDGELQVWGSFKVSLYLKYSSIFEIHAFPCFMIAKVMLGSLPN